MDDPPLQMVQNPFTVHLPSDDGKINIAIRSIFGNENDLVAGDYSQLELRILADLSKEDGLIQVLKFSGQKSRMDQFYGTAVKTLFRLSMNRMLIHSLKLVASGLIKMKYQKLSENKSKKCAMESFMEWVQKVSE